MSVATKMPELIEASPSKGPSIEFRRHVGSISRQSFLYFVGVTFSSGAGYFFKIYLARTLGAEGLGLYALGMTILSFFGVFNALGLPVAASRFVAEYSSKREFSRLGEFLRGGLLALCGGNLVLASVLLILGPWIAVRFYHAPSLRSYFGFFAILMIVGVLNTFLGQIMAGFRDIGRRVLIVQFTGTPLNMVVAVVLITAGFGLRGYLAAQVASSLLILVLLSISIWKKIPRAARKIGGAVCLQKEVFAFSAAAFGIEIVHFALAQSDKIVLGHYLKASDVGVYAVAMAIVSIVPMVLQSVNQIFGPTIAELYSDRNLVLLRQLYIALTKWVVVLTLPLALTIIVFARSFISLFGSGFGAGTGVLVIVVLGELVNCGVGSVGLLLLMSGHQKQLVKIESVSAASLVILSWLLVPRFGITGAAIGVAISLAFTNLWGLAEVKKRLGLFPYDRRYFKLLLPSVLTGAVLVLMHLRYRGAHSWHVVIPALVSGYIFFLGTWWSRGLEGEDRWLADMIRRKFAHFRNS